MKKNTVILLLIFAIPLLGYFILSHKGVSNVSVATTNRPHVIKFTSNMCGACKQVEPIVQKVMTKYQDTVQYTVIPVQVDNDYNQKMIAKYNVHLVPTIIILDKKGHITRRIEGYVSEQTLDSYINGACK